MYRARVYIPVVLLVAVLLGLGLFLKETASAQDKGKEKVGPPVVNWEYKVVSAERRGWVMDANKTEQALNKLGLEGWECISTTSETDNSQDRNLNNPIVHFVLKRPRQ